MPTVKIELAKGKDKQTLIRIRDLVMDAVVESLKIPDIDRNIRIIEYEIDLFQMKPPYEILIEIAMFVGRTKETKTKLYKTIVETLDSNNIIDKDKVLIFVNEQPLENWAGRGGIPADEMNLRTTDPVRFKMIPVRVISVNHFESKLLHAVT